jgi:hypothetical protein
MTFRQNGYNAAAFSKAMNRKHKDSNRERETSWGSLFTISKVNIIRDQEVKI